MLFPNRKAEVSTILLSVTNDQEARFSSRMYPVIRTLSPGGPPGMLPPGRVRGGRFTSN